MEVGIVGASGYTGAELMRLLGGHPEAEAVYVSAHSHAGEKVAALYPNLHGYGTMRYQPFDAREALARADLFFVALPHGESMRVVPRLLEGGAKVIDLSADYRLHDAGAYARSYGLEHTSPHLLAEAVYGLPEIKRGEIAGARLIAVPGCYPTAALLALAPLAAARWAGVDGAVIDAKSGVSGAGRSLSPAAHFPQAEGSVKPYAVGNHRHTPEMEEALSALAGARVALTFVPHLAPMSRGILATCYVRCGDDASAQEVEALYRRFYADSTFVVVLEDGAFPETKAVCGSNYCHLGRHLEREKGMLCVAAAIDNLVKGASGQALQCMNIMRGWDEELGLRAPGIFP